MIFRKKRCRKVKISIKPVVEFKQVLDALDDLELPETDAKPQDIKYAVLEMINNSIRVHRDHGIDEPLSVIFEFVNPGLIIVPIIMQRFALAKGGP